MLITLFFIIMVFAVLLAWRGLRSAAIVFFTIDLIAVTCFFVSVMTTKTGIVL